MVELLSKISDITRPDLISSVSQPTSCHSQTDPTASFHQKRLFFHLKSWVVSCIVMEWQSTEHEVGKGGRQKKNIITRRKSMLCDDIFLMLLKTATEKKSRKLPEKGELFFFRSFVCASTKIMMKERNSFHLQSTPGEFYETLLAPVNAF